MSHSLSDDEVRILSLNAPENLKLLRFREVRILNQIYGEFKNGKTDHITNLATWCCIRDQIRELETILKQHSQGD